MDELIRFRADTSSLSAEKAPLLEQAWRLIEIILTRPKENDGKAAIRRSH